MKKLVLIFTLTLMLCSSVVMAQKVDLEAINAKLEKLDAESQHAKKGLKASTWMNRGNAYFNAIAEPTKVLFVGLDQTMLDISCGKKKAVDKVVGAKTYQTLVYPYFTAYMQNSKVAAWTITKVVNKTALDSALESYAKAFELDPNMKDKVKEALVLVENYYKELGTNAITLNDVKMGADAYLNVCKVQGQPAYDDIDPTIQFYAGYMLTMQGETTPAAYAKGEKVLNEAVANGYLDLEDANKEMNDADRGNIYYYLYHCAYSQREKVPAKIETAKKYLQKGLAKYPMNERIFEGLLQIYTNEKGMGDPKELLPSLDKMIAKNPKNLNAWFAKGRIYYALKEYDECIEAFKHVVEIAPESYDGNYFLGLFYMLKGEDMSDAMKGISYTDQSKYDADVAEMNKVYADAIPCFEAAHKARPSDASTLEYLKTLCFRLRDEPGIMEKYTKYNELFKAL